ncbi:MAG: four helix bundle protein [Gemmatimonadaceae bacterium]
MARGSLAEVETHLETARSLECVRDDQIRSAPELCTRVGSMLTHLIISLRKRPPC